MEDHRQVQRFIEELLKRDLETVRSEIRNVDTRYDGAAKYLAERIQAVRDTATALLPELMRRLEELNNAADRRTRQEAVDRQQYIQANEYREWRANVEKDMKALSGIAQAVGELRERQVAGENRITVIDRALNESSGGTRVARESRQERAWVIPLTITIIANLILFVLTRFLK